MAVRSTAQIQKSFRDMKAGKKPKPVIKPVDFGERSDNEFRPSSFAEVIGQERLKDILGQIVTQSKKTNQTLDHLLFIGKSGSGKTTFAQVMAQELARTVYMVKAPVSVRIIKELGEAGEAGDIVIVDEIHMQGVRRSRQTDPEIFYHILEDGKIVTNTGVEDFPDVTFIGCTTDAGLLPEPFLARFPLQPQLDPYTTDDMLAIARLNAKMLKIKITDESAYLFAFASRGNPRLMNTYVRNARSICTGKIEQDTAVEVIEKLNSTTLDGLNKDMQTEMKVLLNAEREDGKGDLRYQAGLTTIATACGKSKDSRSITLYVEPFLVEQGLLNVGPGGRELTHAGVLRARKLVEDEDIPS